jgi:serine/threonine protein kinase
MGEGYHAHDSRLDRDVAIKVSNAQFSKRFTREARSIAALNHTDICHLYDVGPDYLVMEYVEGQDLHGPLDFDDALPIIRQLIDGIEAAHEKNIVHRDLKPANIKDHPERCCHGPSNNRGLLYDSATAGSGNHLVSGHHARRPNHRLRHATRG